MAPLIRVPENMFQAVEKMLRFRFHDKERERSNRAAALVKMAKGTKRRCPMRHDMIAWSGPPHDQVRAYVCLRCNAAASEPEIKHMGYEFETVPDWIIVSILDMDLQRQAEGNRKVFSGFSGKDDS